MRRRFGKIINEIAKKDDKLVISWRYWIWNI